MVGVVNGSGLGLNFTSFTGTQSQSGVWNAGGLGQRNTQIFVNGYTGNLVVQDQDGLLAAIGTDLQALRTYNSRGSFNDDNGDNWIAGVVKQSMRLTAGTWGGAGSTVSVTLEDGAERLYSWVTNRYVSTTGAGPDTYLTLNAALTQATFSDGPQTGLFDVATGRLLSWNSPTLLNAVFSYDGNGRLKSVAADTGASGGRIAYDYTGDRLQRVTVFDGAGLRVTDTAYAYDANGRLSKVTVDLRPEDGSIADGKVYITDYTYVSASDATNGMLASIVNSDGTSQSFKWVVSEGKARVSQSWGADGRITYYSYDAAMKAMQVTQPGGFTTDFWYDGLGRLKQSHPSKGANNGVTTDAVRKYFEYQATDNHATFADYDKGVTTFTYDADNNLTFVRDPAGGTIRRSYVNRQVTTETLYAVADPDGDGAQGPGAPATTRFVYDSEGKLRFKLTPEGTVTEWRYTGRLPTTTITYQGNSYNVSGLSASQTPTEAQLATWVSSADKTRINRTDTAYDARGQKQSETIYALTDSAGNGLATGKRVVGYAYDAAGRLLVMTDGSSASVTYTYDGLGRILTRQQGAIVTSYVHEDRSNGYVSTVTEQDGRVIVSTYDKMGRLLGVTRKDNGAAMGTTTYHYDARGLLYKTQDATGVSRWSLYDERANKVADIDGNGTLTEYRYDVAQRPIQTIVYANPIAALSGTALNQAWADPPATPTLDAIRPAATPLDQRNWTIYDAAGRPTRTVDAAGYVTDTRYDGTGRVVGTVRYANAINLTVFAANPTNANATPVGNADADRVTRTFYSTEGRLLGELDGEGFLTEYRYDAAGRLTARHRYADAAPTAMRGTGTLAQLRPANNAAKDQVTRYIRDGRDQVIGEIDPEGYVNEQLYDDRGHLVQRTRYAAALTVAQVAAFDAGTGPWRPAATVGVAGDRTERWQYNALNQLESQTDADGTVTRMTYDSAGRVVSTSRASGTVEVRTQKLRYDGLGRVVAELSARGTALLVDGQTDAQVNAIWAQYGTSYSYDLAGRRTSQTVSDGVRTQRTIYFYNQDSLLTHVVNAFGEVQEHQYDGLGQRVKTIAYGGRLGATTLAGLTGGLVNTAISSAVQELLGRRTAEQKPFAHAQTIRDYDARGLLKRTTDALGYGTTTTYNAFAQADTVTEQVRVDGSVVRTQQGYDRRGLQVSITADQGGLNALTRTRRDAFGRVYEQVDARGIIRKSGYDRLGRVVQTTDATQVNRFTSYDAFSRMVETTDGNGHKTIYRYDLAARTVAVTTPEGIESRVTRNRHGEVESRLDGSGVTTTYSYTENGELKKTQTPLGATGASYDSLGRVAESTDANGVVTKFSYDDLNRITARTVDPKGLGLATSYMYEDTDTGTSVLTTEADGRKLLQRFDAAGRLVASTVDPSGLALTTRFELDAQGRTLKITDANGIVTRYGYDALGRRTIEVTDDGIASGDLKLTRTYAYDLAGRLTMSTDWSGARTRYAYDEDNRLVYQIDPLGAVRFTEYDGEGRERRVTRLGTALSPSALETLGDAPTRDAVAGLLSFDSKTDQVSGRVFDKDGRLKYEVDAAGTVTAYRHDRAGRVKQQIAYSTAVDVAGWLAGAATPPPETADDRVTSTLYDALGRALTVVDAEGGISMMEYDGSGNLRKKTAYAKSASAATLQALRAAGGGWTAAMLGAPATHEQDRTNQYRYDAAGRLRFEYDAMGYVSETVYEGLKTTNIRYANKAAFDSAPITDGADRKTSVELDKAGRLWRTTDAMGVESRSVYDSSGRLAAKTEAYGLAEAKTTGYLYDDAGRLVREIVAQGTEAASTTVYGYDAQGRMVSETEARGVALTELDTLWARGERVRLGKAEFVNQLKETDKQALLALYTAMHQYDAAGRRTVTINAMGHRTSTVYDAFGNAVKVTDPRGNAGYFYFDKLNRVRLQVDPEGNATRTTYWGAGSRQVAEVRRFFDRILAPVVGQEPEIKTSSKDALTTNTYDRLDRVIHTTTAAAGGAVKESTVYEVDGNRFDKQVTNKAGGKALLKTDKLGLLTLETLPVSVEGRPVVNRYFYDAFGDRVKSIEAEKPTGASAQWIERTTIFRFDKTGRLTHRIGEEYVAFDGVVQTSSKVIPVEWTRYDALGRVIEQVSRGNWVNNTAIVGGVKSFTRYDAAGNLTERVSADGAFVSYAYDPANNVIRENARATPASLTATGWEIPPEKGALDRTTLMVYDSLGRMVEKFRENVRYWEADAESNQILAPLSAPSTVLLQKWIYDAAGNVVQEIDARNSSVYSYYDKLGRKILKVDQDGYAVAWKYDSYHKVASTETKYANSLLPSQYRRQDDSSQSLTQRDPAHITLALASVEDRTTKFDLDALDRVVEKRVVNVRTNYFDAGGNAIPVTMDAVSNFEYDGLGNVRLQKDLIGYMSDGVTPLWSTQEFQYDALGREVKRIGQGFTDFNGNWVTPIYETEYNGLGLVSRIIERGRVESEDRVTTHTYNDNGDRIGTSDANKGYTSFDLDALGNVSRETAIQAMVVFRPDLPAGQQAVKADRVKRFGYDALGRITSQYDGDAAHSQTGEVRRTRYNVFGEIVAKGLGEGWQEFAEYNVLGKVERNNSDGGAITVTLYDRTGNATRKIVSATEKVDLRTLSIKEAAEDLTRLNHTFSVYDKRNQLLKTAEFKADYQVSFDRRRAALSQELTALYGAISLVPKDGAAYGEATGSAKPFPLNEVTSSGNGQDRVHLVAMDAGLASALGTGTERPPSDIPRGEGASGVQLDWGGALLQNNVLFSGKPKAPVMFQMPSNAAPLTYEILRAHNNALVATVQPNGFAKLDISGGFGFYEDQFHVTAMVGNQRILFGILYLATDIGEEDSGTYYIDQTWRSVGFNQLIVHQTNGEIVRAFTQSGSELPVTQAALYGGGSAPSLLAIGGLPVGSSAIVVQRFDLQGRLISSITQSVHVGVPGGATAVPSSQGSQVSDKAPDIRGSTRPGTAAPVIAFADSILAGDRTGNFWVRQAGTNSDYVLYGVANGVLDLNALSGHNGSGAAYEFVFQRDSTFIKGQYIGTSAGAPQVTNLRNVSPPNFPDFRWDFAVGSGPNGLAVNEYRPELQLLVNGVWINAPASAGGGSLTISQSTVASTAGIALTAWTLNQVPYRLIVKGVRGAVDVGEVARYSGTLTFGHSRSISIDRSEPRYAAIASLGALAGRAGPIVLSGAINRTFADGDALRWDSNGANLNLGSWAASGVTGTSHISYTDGNFSLSGTITLSADGQVSVSVQSTTTTESFLTVNFPNGGYLRPNTMSVRDSNGIAVNATVRNVSDGRFEILIPPEHAGRRFEFDFEAGAQSTQKTTFVGRSYYEVKPDGSATLGTVTTVKRPAFLNFTTDGPADVMKVRLRARDPVGSPWSTWLVTEKVDGDLTGLARSFTLSGYAPTTYDFEYQLEQATGAITRKGRGDFALSPEGQLTLGTLVRDRTPVPPIVFYGPSVPSATKMRLTIDGKSILLNGELKRTKPNQPEQMVYTWQTPLDGAIIDGPKSLDFVMEILDSNGMPARDEVGDVIAAVNGVATFGLSTPSQTFKFEQKVETVKESAQIRRYQRYNAFGQIAEEFDDGTLERAQAMKKQYADSGLGSFSVDSSAVTTKYSYNALGQLITKTDPETFETLDNGFVRRVRPKTTFEYDLIGRNILQTDANGGVTRLEYLGGTSEVTKRYNADKSSRTTAYDIFLDSRKEIDELKYVVLKNYDKRGQLVEVSRLGVSRSSNGIVGEQYSYDGLGQRIARRNALGGTERTFYDALGRVIRTISAGGAHTIYDYYGVAADNLADPILGVGDNPTGGYRRVTTGADLRTSIDEIDYFGRTTWRQDLSGQKFTYRYSLAGQLISQKSDRLQNIRYDYLLNGLVSRIVDLQERTLTEYGYDNAGNRTREAYSHLMDGSEEVKGLMQSSKIQYDELNRISRSWDERKRYDLRYEYDAVGNRRAASATYWDPTTGATSEDKRYWYQYDSMNRFTTTMGSFAGNRGSFAGDESGKIVLGKDGKAVEYNDLGQRIKVTFADEKGQMRVEAYRYTEDGYLQDTFIDGSVKPQATRSLDLLGRTYMYSAWDGAKLVQTKKFLFDADGRTLTETIENQASGNGVTQYLYYDAGTGDTKMSQSGRGALARTVFTSGSTTQTTTYNYEYWDGASRKEIISTQSNLAGEGHSKFKYNANGHLKLMTDKIGNMQRDYVTNAQGLVLSRDTYDYDRTTLTPETRWYFYADGRRVGDVGNDKSTERVSYVEQLAQLALTSKERAARDKAPRPVTTSVDFDQNYEPINGDSPAHTASSYTVRRGDTLSSIAQSVWGDSAMWYMIADVNGLEGGEPLVEGQVLVIPNKVTNIHNNSTTYRPYNPGEAIGNVNPTLPEPPPPPGKGGCGGIGTILMVVVAVVVTVYTAGAAASMLGATTVASGASATAFSTGLAVMAGGSAAGVTLAGTGALIAGAAIGAAAGAYASQLVGMATGNVDKFSWKAVAQAALSGGVTAGVGAALSSAVTTGGVLHGTAVGNALAPTSAVGSMTRAGLSSVVGQAMQGKWNWREVGAAVVAGGAGHLAGEAVGSAINGLEESASRIGRSAVAAAAASWASSQVMGYNTAETRARLGQAFISGLGQGIGNELGDSLSSPMQPRDQMGDFIDEKLAEQSARDLYGLASAGPLRLGRSSVDAMVDWSVRADQGIADAARRLPVDGRNVADTGDMSADEFATRRSDVEEQLRYEIFGQEARDASVNGAQLFQTGGVRSMPRRGVGNFEMVRNGNWDAALNIGADPLGLLGESLGLQSDLAQLSRIQTEKRVEGMRRAIIDAGAKNVPGGYSESWVQGADGITRNVRDYGATVKELQGVYESHVRDQRLRETWGDDYQNVRIGKSQMSVLDFEKRVLDIHMNATDRAYSEGVDAIAKREMEVKPGQYAQELGNFIDRRVRTTLRDFARAEGINDSSMSNLWAINRRISNEYDIGIPDNRLGLNLYADTTLARKNANTPQIMKWNDIRSGNFLIIRPTALGGAYVIPRAVISLHPKPVGRGI